MQRRGRTGVVQLGAHQKHGFVRMQGKQGCFLLLVLLGLLASVFAAVFALPPVPLLGGMIGMIGKAGMIGILDALFCRPTVFAVLRHSPLTHTTRLGPH